MSYTEQLDAAAVHPDGGSGDRMARLIDRLDPPRRFNLEHFRMWHMVAELLRPGLLPGVAAPDFELRSTDGSSLRLSSLRDRPVLLHFVSYTCPVTRGGVEAMKHLYRQYGKQVWFVEVLVRQAHPGERHGAYRTYDQKFQDACDYRDEERVPWPVMVDDLGCTVQRAYGGLAAAAYLIDTRGRVAFCGTWGLGPSLTPALDDLLAGGGVGTPAGSGADRRPHLAGAIVGGRSGPARGGRRSLIDLELGFPGGNLLMLIGPLFRQVTEARQLARLSARH